MDGMEHLRDMLPQPSATDRCDHRGCEAQAYVSVLMRFEHRHPMLWCGHHWREVQEAVLAQQPFAVRDDLKVLEAR